MTQGNPESSFQAAVSCIAISAGFGGAKGSRTPDLLHAMQALSQLSYGPIEVAGLAARWRVSTELVGSVQGKFRVD